MARFAVELLRTIEEHRVPDTSLSVSRSNELLPEYQAISRCLFEIDTFRSAQGALTEIWRVPGLRCVLQQRLAEERVDWVVNLMPHVWTPLMIGAVRAAGSRFATIVHDAVIHPGDRSGLASALFNREARRADHVFTLSRQVRSQLVQRWPRLEATTSELFHPDMPIGPASGSRAAEAGTQKGSPFQLLFFGRILPYKGLPLLVEALEILRARDIHVRLTVLGDGEIGALRPRLESLGADLRIGWFDDETLAKALCSADAVALSHIEASQSGIASVAAAAGVPVIATPVGGLVEQIREGTEGVLASAVEPAAFADAVERLVVSPHLVASIRSRLSERGQERSMAAFLFAMRLALEKASSARLNRSS